MAVSPTLPGRHERSQLVEWFSAEARGKTGPGNEFTSASTGSRFLDHDKCHATENCHRSNHKPYRDGFTENNNASGRRNHRHAQLDRCRMGRLESLDRRIPDRVSNSGCYRSRRHSGRDAESCRMARWEPHDFAAKRDSLASAGTVVVEKISFPGAVEWTIVKVASVAPR